MTRRIRHIILYFSISIFFLISPAVILYAWGYSFDFEKRKPVLTGGFYFTSIPREAQVYLDDKSKTQTPAFIKRLVPKIYQVRINKEGFHVWEKRMKIQSSLVTEAKDILLIPFNPTLELIRDDLEKDFILKEFLLPQEPAEIFYIEKPSFILYKTDQNNSFKEQISLSPLPEGHEYQIIVSDHQKITVLDQEGQLYLFNPESRSFELIAQDVLNVRFCDDNKKFLYFSSSEIWLYSLTDLSRPKNENQELITRLSQEIKDAVWYGKTNQHIVFITGEELKIIELDNRDRRNIFDIIKIKDMSQVAYNPNDEQIYIVKNEELMKLGFPD